MVMMSPFADSIRQQPINASQFGLGALLERLSAAQPINRITRDLPQAVMTYDQAMSRNMQRDMKLPEEQARIDAAIDAGPTASRPAQIIAQRENLGSALDPSNTPQFNQSEFDTFMGKLDRGQQDMINMFAKHQAQQLQQQMEQQLQQRQNPMMGMGLGGARPYGMDPYRGFGRPQFPMQQPMPRGGYNQYQNQFGGMMGMQQQPYQQPQYQNFNMQQPYMNPYQQMRPQPQQYGGYNQYQQMGGYGNYGAMPNPYQPQQMGYNPNNYGNYAQNQFQGYGGMQAQSQGVY
jgi:hypothetical protein